MGKNLGFCLSLWDWAFGTLYMPDKREKLEFGLGHESAGFASIGELLMRPFHNALRLLTSRAKPEPSSAPIPAVVKHET
jgi:hypothetical protein